MLGLWDVVNNLTRLRPTRRERYRVTIFGSARTDPGHWAYAAVRDLAAELTRLGCDIVTGGGPGLMRAANEGARMAGADPDQASVGIRIELPFEQDVNPFETEMFPMFAGEMSQMFLPWKAATDVGDGLLNANTTTTRIGR